MSAAQVGELVDALTGGDQASEGDALAFLGIVAFLAMHDPRIVQAAKVNDRQHFQESGVVQAVIREKAVEVALHLIGAAS